MAWRLLFVALLLPQAVAAQAPSDRLWLPAGSAIVAALETRPAEELAPSDHQAPLGRLLFSNPDILGGNARRIGLSCNACHPSGHRNPRFLVAGLSDGPGTVDTSHAFWNLANDNGRLDPLPIPTLRGSGAKAHFGRDRIGLEQFIARVIETEFAGAPPAPAVVAALASYIRALRPTDAADRAVTLRTDLAEASEGIEIVAALAERGDHLTGLAAAAVRGHLGRMAERFHRPEHQPAISQLSRWAATLRDIERLADAGDHRPATRHARGLLGSLNAEPLAGAVAGSLYDGNEIRRVFGP